MGKSPPFTDDATVVDRSGVEIQLIAGDIRNIKITFPEDIIIAEVYLNEKI
jgi:2-C-methyl-D-erythritol 4-phosphate cytidylyltransferase